MRRFGLSGAVLALLVAVALTAVAPAGAKAPGPTLKHCHGWPGETVVHWDSAWLAHQEKNYGPLYAVTIHWVVAGLNVYENVKIQGDNARTRTFPGAAKAYAVLHLGRDFPHTNTVTCAIP